MKFVAAAILLPVLPLAFAKKPKVEHAPLPERILAAKTVYIENESGNPDIADKAYTQLKHWGHYQVVNSKEGADLVFQFTVTHSTRQSEDVGFTSLYNSKTGSYTYGTVPGGTSTLTWSFTYLKIIDPKTQDVMWEDQCVQRRKKSATDEIMQSLRGRVEEQEKAGGQ